MEKMVTIKDIQTETSGITRFINYISDPQVITIEEISLNNQIIKSNDEEEIDEESMNSEDEMVWSKELIYIVNLQ